ncbi:BRO family protein [Rhizobium sp. SGZ-381]|uniref:BRO family protein n=1 Tax=Rhizobium sp. SGZ-381 TaxID=3342800 RepID=UPI00366AC009
MMTFDFENLPVRAFQKEGQDWFVAVDVCRCLGLENSRQALTRLPDEEKGVTVNDTLGGPQEMASVNEPGLYRLIFTSTKPEAERLKRFVFHEVLPALRRTGAYAPQLDFEIMREKLALVKETRLTHGRRAAQALWRELGLPLEERAESAGSTDHERSLSRYISDFLDECCQPDPMSRVQSSDLYALYCRWAPQANAPHMTLSGFGKGMVKSAYARMKSNGSYYCGLRVRADIRAKLNGN